MTVSTTPTTLRLTHMPVVEVLIASTVVVLFGIVTLTAAGNLWGRIGFGAAVLVGLALLLRVERLDHRFDRSRGTIALRWGSLIGSRHRELRIADVRSIAIEEDTAAENGRPTRLVLILQDASEVPLCEGFVPLRTPVMRASAKLAQFLGVPARERR